MGKGLLELSSSTRDLLGEIWQRPTFADQWVGDERLLGTIESIRNARQPGAIADLVHLALSESRTVQKAARRALSELVQFIPVESLPMLDEVLRHDNPWRQLGYENHWYRLRPEKMKGMHSGSIDDAVLLRLTASHRNGYVRAEALRQLSEDTSKLAIPFILMRCTDWVDEVRSAAEIDIALRLRAEYGETFVDCLPLLDRLRNSSRLRNYVSKAIESYLRRPELSSALRRGMKSSRHSVRRASFRLAVENPVFSSKELIEAGTCDPDVLVRRWAVQFGVEAVPENSRDLMERAALDRYSPIRRLAFEWLVAHADLQLDWVVSFLFDTSAAIRHQSQDLVVKLSGDSSAIFYRSAIQRGGDATIVCVLGLAETGDAQDASAVAALIENRPARMRIAVIRALRALGQDRDLDLAKIVRTDVPSVAREAAVCMLQQGAMPMTEIWHEALKNSDVRLWLAVLKLARRASKWAQLPVYLEALGNPREELSTEAINQLKGWMDRFNRSFTEPAPGERDILPGLFEAARGKLPTGLARQLSFVFATAFTH